MRSWIAASIVFLAVAAGSDLPAAEIAGVRFESALAAADSTLSLNGVGLRTKTFLRIKVYAAGLYLPRTCTDGEVVAAADEPQALRMVFIYDGVSPEKLVESWNEGFEESTDGELGPLKERIDAFNSFFTAEAREGDVYEFRYLPGPGLQVVLGGEVKGTIPGLDFKRAFFGIWLGEDPVDDDLKAELLGLDP